ncbi:MAG: DnaA/Hda family protein [Paracoccaceae bacterium]
MTRQLAFDLPAKDSLTRDEFFVSPANALALTALEGWQDWPGAKMVLVGPAGSGKTHLAHIWADLAGAILVTATDLAAADLPDLAQGGAVVVDDADTLAGQPEAEAALFHLHNLLASGGVLLVTASSPPRDWGLRLPDLLSRMQAAPVIRLEPPDDALLSAVLVKLFADRQIEVTANLISYLLVRMPRGIGAARALVAALDAHALAAGRPITRALAADILDSADPE